VKYHYVQAEHGFALYNMGTLFSAIMRKYLTLVKKRVYNVGVVIIREKDKERLAIDRQGQTNMRAWKKKQLGLQDTRLALQEARLLEKLCFQQTCTRRDDPKVLKLSPYPLVLLMPSLFNNIWLVAFTSTDEDCWLFIWVKLLLLFNALCSSPKRVTAAMAKNVRMSTVMIPTSTK
jgi:hypothetical protein